MEKQVQIIASDAGGTMTDMMVVDGEEVDAMAVSLWYSYMNAMPKGSEA
jgi:N-methylhydantoinase A/oxoprolinase/acetone carboxylase beta subunit